MYMTQNLRLIVTELLKAPDAEHYGIALKNAIHIDTSAIYGVLRRLTAAGYLNDLGIRPSASGGSPRHVYRVANIEGLRELVNQQPHE
jgi:DNA-binding PadR family transcriptional regulator